MKRRFERIYKMIECKSYLESEDNPENKEMSVYGFKHIKTDKFDKYIIIGWESDDLYENDKLLNLWSNKFLNKDEKREISR